MSDNDNDEKIEEFINEIIKKSSNNEDNHPIETIEKTENDHTEEEEKKPKRRGRPRKVVVVNENNDSTEETTTEPPKPPKPVRVKPTQHERSPAQIQAFKRAQETRRRNQALQREAREKILADAMEKVYIKKEADAEKRRVRARMQRDEKNIKNLLTKLKEKQHDEYEKPETTKPPQEDNTPYYMKPDFIPKYF